MKTSGQASISRSQPTWTTRRLATFVATTSVIAGMGVAVAPQISEGATKPIVYLTFDDGPSRDSGSTQILDVLDRYGVDATFFVNGANISGNEAVLQRMYSDGHAVGNHTWSHAKLNTLSINDARSEIRRTHDLVKSVTGVDLTCFRPPWGSTFLGDFTDSGTSTELISSFGYALETSWRIDASDYTVSPVGDRDAMVSRLLQMQDGDIVLLHDGHSGKQSTVAAVDYFLATYRDRYDFRPLPTCAGPPPPTTTTTTTTTSTTLPGPIEPTSGLLITNTKSVAEILLASDYLPEDANVLRLYRAFFDREPDLAGAKYWLLQSHAGADLDGLSFAFSESSEFGSTYGKLDDDDFLRIVYLNVLQRSPDAAGLAYWAGLVRSGELTRHGAVRWIASGTEFARAFPYLAA